MPLRRSGRERKANPRYDDSNAWDKETLRRLRRASTSSGSSPSDSDAEAESDHDFARRPLPDQIIEKTSSENNDNDEGLAVGTSDDSDPADNIDDATPSRKAPRRFNPISATQTSPISIGHARGLKPLERHGGSVNVAYQSIFGPEVEDLRPVLHARDHWRSARDITVPSRTTLSDAESSFLSVWPEKPATSTSTLEQELLNRQTTSHVSESILETIDSKLPAQTIALERPTIRKTYNLKPGQPYDLGYSIANIPASPPVTGQDWLLNVGRKIGDVAWVPNLARDQFLAIGTKATAKERKAANTGPAESGPPAFHPSAAWRAEVQIWHVPIGPESSPPQDGLPFYPPSVALTGRLILDCGDIRQLAWSPLDSTDSYRLLAVLSTDAHVRVLSVDFSDRTKQDIHVDQAAIDIISPPDAIFTTIAWSSAYDLALGCSDGSLRLYNTLQYDVQPLSPYLTTQPHNTYTTSLVPAYPSSISTYIASASAAGDILLTNLRSPTQDLVSVPKARLPSKPLVYLPFTRSWLVLHDAAGATEPKGPWQTSVQCHHLRHFYSSTQIARLPEASGPGTALAASVHHPCILIGNAKGAVFATNYIRRVLPVYIGKVEHGGYLQKVVEVEYRPDPDQPRAGQGVDGIFHGPDIRPGTTLFSSPRVPEPIDLISGGTASRGEKGNRKKVEGKRKRDGEEALAADVIYEEEQAVVELAWNPNQRYAGWAAMAWGSGIVRVMDLSHDAT